MKNFLTYEEFGAVGDGKHDDFDAIIACHEEANRTGTSVRAKDDAVYYIGGKDATATIKTDVDFGEAKFIIDDRKLERITSYVFTVASDFPKYDIKIDTLKKGQTKLDIPHEGNIYVRVYNENKKIFIRKGLNMNSGTAANDCFIVDKDGNIYPSIDWDYPTVTKAYAKCVDDEPITVRGGIFVTIANEAPSFYNYHRRGILVNRAHVTVTEYKHYVENEGEHGAPYHGFVCVNEGFDVTISNALATPRFIFRTASQIPGKDVAMGSYDFSFWGSIDVKCKNIKQTIDILDKRYWGIYTSNFCKNLSLEDCVFSRFDAHQGVTNVNIKRCTLGHQSIQLIGHGEFVIEDSVMMNDSCHFMYLRCDYGSLWDGNITIRNCEWRTNAKYLRVINCNNPGDHDFGYQCIMAHTITIDGLKLISDESVPLDELHPAILTSNVSAKDAPFAYITPKKLVLSRIETNRGVDFAITMNPEKYPDLEVIYNK